MVDTPITAVSPLQALVPMFGSSPSGTQTQPGTQPGLGGAGASIGGGANNMISALMKGYNNTQNAQALAPNAGTYEGNIQTPANPMGTVTPPAMPSSPGMPPPQTGGAPPPAPSMPPVNPFTHGARPTPFLNTSALFGQPPMGGMPGMPAQRPNPMGQMQL